METTHEPTVKKSTPKDPSRLIGLSDGVFATVLTLLVLDLRVSEIFNAGGGNTYQILKSIGPHLFSYLLTFLVAGSYWLRHHRDFDQIVSYDRGLLSYNLLFLLFIGLLPFSTAIISLDESQSMNYSFYWAIYAANIALAGIMLTLTWNYAASHHLIYPERTQAYYWNITLRGLMIPFVFLLSIVSEYLFPKFVSQYTLLAIPFANKLIDRFLAQTDPEIQPGQSGWRDMLWQSSISGIWIIIIGFAVWASSLK